MAYVPMTRAYWATSAAGHVTVIDLRGPTRITDYVRNTRQPPRWNPWKWASGGLLASRQANAAGGAVSFSFTYHMPVLCLLLAAYNLRG